MIKGSPIAKEFRDIFASGFSYDANDVPAFAAQSVNYTTKIQYLFRINKGILNSWDNKEINRFTPDEKRPRPFSRMIYIGDGETGRSCNENDQLPRRVLDRSLSPEGGAAGGNQRKCKRKDCEKAGDKTIAHNS